MSSERTMKSIRQLALLGIGFAAVAVILGIVPLSHAVLPHILRSGDSVSFLEITDGHPAPRLLAWNQTEFDWLYTLAHSSSAFLLCVSLLSCVVWIAAVSVINPYFLASSPPHGIDLSDEEGEPIHPSSMLSRCVRALLIVALVGVPVAALWIVPGMLTHASEAGPGANAISPASNAVWAFRWVSLGSALWIGFAPEGLAGHFEQGRLQLSIRSLAKLAAQGALFGLAVFACMQFATPYPLLDVLRPYSALGTFNLRYWHEIATHYLLGLGLLGMAAGTLLVALGSPDLTVRQRMSILIVPIAATCGGALVRRPMNPRTLAARMDWTYSVATAAPLPFRPSYPVASLPDGPAAGLELARRTGVAVGSTAEQPDRNVLVFTSLTARMTPSVFIVIQNGFSEDGLSAAGETTEPTLAFLKHRDYESALSWVAIKHLYNVATVHFAPSAAIRSLLLDNERCPHYASTEWTLWGMFYICAASSENLALLDEWADETKFTHPDRASRRLMGDLYMRFGAADKAMAWYGRAEMPNSFLRAIRARKPLFHMGRVRGRFVLNGKPLVGIQVGIFPRRMNGLPQEMEPMVFRARDQIIAPFAYSDLFPALHPRPYSFRWISAGTITNNKGEFDLNGLTEGDYNIVCTLPAELHLSVPKDDSMKIHNTPGDVELKYEHPDADMGTIDIAVHR